MDLPEMTNLFDQTEERAVLACCLLSKVARTEALKHLTGSDFYSPHHELLWDTMHRLDRQELAVDPVSVRSVVRPHDHTGHLTRLIMDLGSYPIVPGSVDSHAHTVRQFAVRRRLFDESLRVRQLSLDLNVDVLGMAATAVTRFQSIRDVGNADNDIESMTVEELMLEFDEEPEWLIPNLVEEGDRFLLTGEEGLGKSHLLRQIVLFAAAGLDPFDPTIRIPPVKGMIIDFENSKRQVRRRLRGTYEYALAKGRGEPGLATLLQLGRSDITSDKVLSKIHRELDACQPQVLAIGPLYKMTPTALQTDTEATPVLAALDTIRDRGIALLIEAHAGKADSSGTRRRDMRPRGSSALLGWPEFGYGMVAASENTAALKPWRGDRDFRDIPDRVVRSEHGLWLRERAVTAADYWRTQQPDWNERDDDDGGDASPDNR